MAPEHHTPCRKFYSNLYVQVLTAIAIGVVFGFVAPDRAAAMKPLGDGFIKLVKMLIAPIVFTTVVVGIAQMGAMKEVGRIGLRALIYFEFISIARAGHRPGRRRRAAAGRAASASIRRPPT